MKRLVLIRHAKSSWANPLQSDFERPLNDRGEHDAPLMGNRLKAAGILPDLIISSTARRAAHTARLIAMKTNYDPNHVEWEEELYHCVPAVFEEVIEQVNDSIQTLFIVAHNPGISEFAAQLDGHQNIRHLSTCSVAGFELDTDHWADLGRCPHKTFLFDSPKNIYE